MFLWPNMIYKWALHYEQAGKNSFFLPVLQQLVWNGILSESMKFLVFVIGYSSSWWNFNFTLLTTDFTDMLENMCGDVKHVGLFDF